MKRLSKSMVVCFMAAVMIMTVGCQKEDIAPIIPDSPIIPDGALPMSAEVITAVSAPPIVVG